MRSLHSPDRPWISRNWGRWILAFSWCAGLVCGCYLFVKSGVSLDTRMRDSMMGTVSIVRLFLVTFFPFLLCAVAAVFSVPALFVLICFCKALTFSFASLGIWLVFGSAGWLCHWLLLFSNSIGVCILLLFWIRHLPRGGNGNKRFWDFPVCAVFLFALCVVDNRMILPFWADIFY